MKMLRLVLKNSMIAQRIFEMQNIKSKNFIIPTLNFCFLRVVFTVFTFAIIILLSTFNASSKNVYAANIINNIQNDEDIVGPGVLRLHVAGDSYADHFIKEEDGRDIKLYKTAYPGKTIEENFDLILGSIDNSFRDVLLCIGVNDHYQQTPPYEFESTIRKLFDYATLKNKNLIVHTYMNYTFPMKKKEKYELKYYNKALESIANTYMNVYFIDLSDLDLSYLSSDMLHYNHAFYDIFYDRIHILLEALNNMSLQAN